MVVTVLPLAAETGSTHERTGSPSRCTVQAPHCARPQPKCGLSRPRSEERRVGKECRSVGEACHLKKISSELDGSHSVPFDTRRQATQEHYVQRALRA